MRRMLWRKHRQVNESRGVSDVSRFANIVTIIDPDAMLVILRCLGRSQRCGSEIHAESFAPYGYCAVFSQVQVAIQRVVLVADVALDDSEIDETSLLHRRHVLRIVRGDHVDVHIRTV